MKKIIVIIGCGMLFFVSGCDGFLTEVNKSNIVSDEFYTTESGFESLVNATYAQLRVLYQNEPWVYVGGTDMFVQGRNGSPEGITEYRNLTPTSGIVEEYYSNLFQAVQMCNTALYYADKTEDFAALEGRIGEVKFLRAYFYFMLVQSFGGVSIVTERIDEPRLKFKRDSAEKVYEFIVTEMKEALQLVPESNDFGRVDKRVIRHYLAKVYLTRGYEDYAHNNDFELAAQFADAAINGQPLTLTYEEVFYPGNEENEEIIFSVQFDESSMNDPADDGSMQNYFFGPYLGGEGAKQGYPYRSYTLVPTMYVFNLYTKHDARFKATFMVKYYERYYDYYDQKGNRDELDISYYYPPKWAVDDTTAWRQAAPEHRANTIIYPYSQAWEASPNTTTDSRTPIVKKFDDPTSVFSNSGSSSRDIFLARLAETYLIAAESYYQLDNLGLAAKRINEVRVRAAKPGHEAKMRISPSEVDLDLILDERARELLGEYKRWFDLKRTGTLVERTRKYHREIRNWFESGVNPFMGQDGNLKILRPIPQSAIDLNKTEIEQNPGY